MNIICAMETNAQVICIGNEIMMGDIANTNAQFVSSKLASIGIKTSKHIDIPDSPETIISSVRKALAESDIVILSGGLGPTVDDITLECISKALNKKLILDKKIAGLIKSHFKKRGLQMPANNMRQALVPERAIPIINNTGTAPGLIVPVEEKALLAFPGVPHELHSMFQEIAMPYLKNRFSKDRIIKSRVIKITGLSESRVNELIEDILRISGNVQMGIYPYPEEIHVKITVFEKLEKSADKVISKIEKQIRSRLKSYIFGYNNDTLEEVVGKTLLAAKKTLAVAESCTGGLLANRITDVPGSSNYFKLGVVAYSNRIKEGLLNIPKKTIKQYGAVSKQVAGLMAKNVILLAGSDYGIGISGIAGPGGATDKKQVGLVCISLATRQKIINKEFRFIGSRKLIKYKSTQAALNLLRAHLV